MAGYVQKGALNVWDRIPLAAVENSLNVTVDLYTTSMAGSDVKRKLSSHWMPLST